MTGDEALSYITYLLWYGNSAVVKTKNSNCIVNYGTPIKFYDSDMYIVSDNNYTVEGYTTVSDENNILGSTCSNEIILPISTDDWELGRYDMYYCDTSVLDDRQKNNNTENLFDQSSSMYIDKDAKFRVNIVAEGGYAVYILGAYFEEIN